jgi:hypothetical protein
MRLGNDKLKFIILGRRPLLLGGDFVFGNRIVVMVTVWPIAGFVRWHFAIFFQGFPPVSHK